MYNAHKQQGTSLIEILITLVVLAIGLTSIIVFQTSVSSSNTMAEQRTEASHLAQQKIEQLKDIRTATDYDALAPSNSATVVGSSDNTQYNLSWSVVDAAGINEAYKTLNVKVKWKDKKGKDQEVNLHTVASTDSVTQIASLASTATPSGNGNCSEYNTDGKDDDNDNDGTDDGFGTDDDSSSPDDDKASYNDDGKDDDADNDNNDDHDFSKDDGVNDDTFVQYCESWYTGTTNNNTSSPNTNNNSPYTNNNSPSKKKKKKKSDH